MPEVVVPTPDVNGKPRTWDQVFPIWNNDDESTEYRVINQILEAIAMNNRFGGRTIEELKQYILTNQHEFFRERLAENVGKPHDHKKEKLEGHTEWGCTKDEIIPEDRLAVIAEREKYFQYYGKWMYYIEEVFANYGAAWREHK